MAIVNKERISLPLRSPKLFYPCVRSALEILFEKDARLPHQFQAEHFS